MYNEKNRVVVVMYVHVADPHSVVWKQFFESLGLLLCAHHFRTITFQNTRAPAGITMVSCSLASLEAIGSFSPSLCSTFVSLHYRSNKDSGWNRLPYHRARELDEGTRKGSKAQHGLISS